MKNKKDKSKSVKGYTHFDYRSSLNQNFEYVSNPENVANHGFYPLIHFKDIQKKYDKTKDRKYKQKVRKLYYSSHLDRSIYMHYASILNKKYNERIKADDMDDSVIAYRTDLRGKSSYDFAIDAFARMLEMKDCQILIGDFTSFFDELDHVILKQKIQDLLGVERLSDDWFRVYEQITKYQYVELGSLVYMECQRQFFMMNSSKEKYIKGKRYTFCKCPIIDFKIENIKYKDEDSWERIAFEDYSLIEPKASSSCMDCNSTECKCSQPKNSMWKNGACINRECYKTFNKLSKFDIEEVRRLHEINKDKHKIIKRHKDSKGIPQGTAISAILANVYMLDFDKQVNDMVKGLGGVYMRYSDDFIIILPDEADFKLMYGELQEIIRSVKLEVKDDKTQIYKHSLDSSPKIQCVMSQYIDGAKKNKDMVEYLGLAYDGESVEIKDATRHKFLRRANRKLKSILKQREVFGDCVGTRQFRQRYTALGKKGFMDSRTGRRVSGTYLSYEDRVNEKIYEAFDEFEKPTSVEENMSKMMRKLNKK